MQIIPATPLRGGESGVDGSAQPARRRRNGNGSTLGNGNGSTLGLLAGRPGGESAGAAADVVAVDFGPRRRPLLFTEGYVRRARLVRPLLEDSDASLVLIAAPPGYGKTSLLCEWDASDTRPFAWVTLTEEDDDPARLLGSIARAVDALKPTDRRVIAAHPAARGEPAATQVARLLRTIGGAAGGMVLVLDDVQLLRSPESLALLASLAAAMPRGTKLALSSRTLPAISLGRLRAQRAVLGLGARELAMTIEESGRLLVAAGLDLDAAGIEQLVARTEGWPAGLYLAALSLRGQSDAAAGVERFAGADRLIADYIGEELLAGLSPASLTFLMRVSILENLSAELCDDLLEETGSGEILRALAAGNLLVAPLDASHSRYRAHPLLRDVLAAELARVEPARIADLHRRAARWFGERGDMDRALSHAVAAGETRYAGELLWTEVPSCVMRGCNATMQRWLGMFTETQIASSAHLAVAAAHSRLVMGDLPAAEHWANTASAARPPEPHADGPDSLSAAIAIIHAAAARHGVARAGEEAARAYELVDGASPWRAICCLLGGVSDHLAGEHVRARQTLREGAIRGAVGAPYVETLCLSQLALMAAEEEDWDEAFDLAARASARLARGGLEQEPTSALVFAASAWISAKQGLADRAKRDLGRSTQLLALLDDFIPWYEVETRVLQARAAIRLADVTHARALLAQASRLTRRAPDAVPIFRMWLDRGWDEIDAYGAAALSGPSSLTMAELRILRFLPTHLSFREIGCRLHVSTNTVKSQAHAVYRKLDVESRSGAVERASTLGLIDACVI